MSKKFDIHTLSELARINLSEDEKDALATDLAKILDYVEALDELDTARVEPTSHVLHIENVFRDDCAIEQGTAAELLHVLPGSRKEGRFFRVPKIIEDQR
jgi:aspartyl-tRNA(Asn)/glutamyl-tRNA(Gln) amidotransferase subunit C